jgi:hypothetical protein
MLFKIVSRKQLGLVVKENELTILALCMATITYVPPIVYMLLLCTTCHANECYFHSSFLSIFATTMHVNIYLVITWFDMLKSHPFSVIRLVHLISWDIVCMLYLYHVYRFLPCLLLYLHLSSYLLM